MGRANYDTSYRLNGMQRFDCLAWVNFNGAGTVAIRASGNISGVTDNGVGDYTFNFTSALPDANYAIAGAASNFSGGTMVVLHDSTLPTASACRIYTIRGNEATVDVGYVTVMVVR
jgi:hypothetical protein